MFQQLPYQKLSGYPHSAEDFEPYPCLFPPVPEVVEVEPDLEEAGRSKRSFFYEPPEQKNDVYSVFKVPDFRSTVGSGSLPDRRVFSRTLGSNF